MKKSLLFLKKEEDIIRRSKIPGKLKKRILHVRDKREYLWGKYEYKNKIVADCGYDRLSLYDGDDNTLIEKITIDKNYCFHETGSDEYILLEQYESKHTGNIAYVATVLDRKHLMLEQEYLN